MANVLVTGGAGFIGSHVAKALLERNHQVTVIDDLSGGFIENVDQRADFIQHTIYDDVFINDLFGRKKFDYVFHLAAYAAEGLSHFIKRFNYNNNLIGSINLINASINTSVKCFVFTSSIAVYGASPELPMTEAMTPHPEDSYGIAKFSVELELKACKNLFGLNSIIFRPHNVYGEHQNIGDKYRNVVGIFMNQILQNKPMTIFGDGNQTRAFSYIGDVAPLIAESIDIPAAYNEIFNVGADQPYSVNDLALHIAKAMQVEPNIMYLPARNEVVDAYSSHEKIRRVFGKRKSTSLEEGAGSMAAWVREHGARKSKVFENIEVRRNLPSAWLS